MKNLSRLSLGEGNTPLIRLYNLEKKLLWKGELWAKCEFQNPTGSFKDRGSVAEVSEALKQNKKGVVCASTGNMAASLAAYSARAKLSCVVFIPESTPSSKMRQAEIYGAKLIKVNGTYNDCVQKALLFSKKNKYLLCGDYATRRFGQSSIGLELANSKINFNSFIVPVGNGTVGCAVSEGFSQKSKLPKFIGAIAIGNNNAVASAMKVKFPLDKKITNDWLLKTDGKLFEVSDSDIILAQKLLATTDGLFVETSGASTVAILQKIKNEQIQKTVLILTGNGLKEEVKKYE